MNKVVSFLKDLEKGKVSETDLENENPGGHVGKMEVAVIEQPDDTYLLATYFQDAVRLLKKGFKFRFKQVGKRFECEIPASTKLPKRKDVEFVKPNRPKPCPPSALRKLRGYIEALEKQEAGIDKAMVVAVRLRDKIKNLITEHGVHNKPGLSEDAFVIYEKNRKAHAVVSTHVHYNNVEILELAKNHPLLKTCVTYEPMVHRSRVEEVWDQLTPAVQQKIMELTVSPSALHFFELKGKRCQVCGGKLTKNAKTQEETCKTCED